MNCARDLLAALLMGMAGCLMALAPSQAAEPPGPPTAAALPTVAPELEAVRLDYEIALATVQSGDLEGAAVMLREIVERAPAAVTPLASLAIVQVRLGHLDAAQKSLQDAIAKQPEAALYNELGIVQRQQGHFAEARQSYQQALALDERFARAHLNLAILCDLYLGELPTAMEHYRRFQELSGEGDKSQVANWIGDLERRLKVTP